MLKFIGKQFRKPSGVLGRLISMLMKKGNKNCYDIIIPKLAINKGDRILEIGYGHGVGIDRICNEFDCHITGIDFSELMFAEAKKRNRKHIENNHVELYFGNYLDFKLDTEIFDSVFFVNVIYFWNNLEQPFHKIFSELRFGGKICLYMARCEDLEKYGFTTGIFNKYTLDFVCYELSKAGFKNIDSTFNLGYYITAEK